MEEVKVNAEEAH